MRIYSGNIIVIGAYLSRAPIRGNTVHSQYNYIVHVHLNYCTWVLYLDNFHAHQPSNIGTLKAPPASALICLLGQCSLKN